ncbi:MAG TPA: hypothetical protein VI542_30285 [Candidatus Tectomicrobia bacterium]
MACRERATVVTAVDHPRPLPVQVSPVSRTINTYGVERNNLTVCQHARRWGRKVHAFAKELDYLGHPRTLAFADYHFVVPHRSVRQRLPHSLPTQGRNGSRKQWKPVTPAMASGLTDHVWPMEALLSFRVPPKPLWCCMIFVPVTGTLPTPE